MERRERDHWIYSERFALGAVLAGLALSVASLALNVAAIGLPG